MKVMSSGGAGWGGERRVGVIIFVHGSFDGAFVPVVGSDLLPGGPALYVTRLRFGLRAHLRRT